MAFVTRFLSSSHAAIGRKNAGIVFDDMDLEKCVPAMIRSSFINQGEVCLTTSRYMYKRESTKPSWKDL